MQMNKHTKYTNTVEVRNFKPYLKTRVIIKGYLLVKTISKKYVLVKGLWQQQALVKKITGVSQQGLTNNTRSQQLAKANYTDKHNSKHSLTTVVNCEQIVNKTNSKQQQSNNKHYLLINVIEILRQQ